MKKKRWLMLIFFLPLLGQSVAADDNGNLQLIPSIITNSNGGVGKVSEFPIRNELFLPTLNQISQEQMQDNVFEQKQALNFSAESSNMLYNTDTAKLKTQLFESYQPQVIVSSEELKETQTMIWYWLISAISIFLVFLAILLGKKNAKRSIRKRK